MIFCLCCGAGLHPSRNVRSGSIADTRSLRESRHSARTREPTFRTTARGGFAKFAECPRMGIASLPEH